MAEAPGQPPNPPKHKPNPRHTLEEVLRSLQDMVRNELSEADRREAPPRPAPEPPAAGAASPREIEYDLRTVLHTLDDETGHGAAAAVIVGRGVPERPAETGSTRPIAPAVERSATPEAEFTLEPSPFPPPPANTQPETPPAAPAPDTWSGAQPDLPLLELHAETAITPPVPEHDDVQFVDTGDDELTPVRTPEPGPILPPVAESALDSREPPPAPGPAIEAVATADTVAPPAGETPTADAEVQFVDTGPDAPGWEEIPVLEDAVYVPPESGWTEIPPDESGPPDTGTTPPAPGAPATGPRADQPPEQLEVPLPSPEGARDIAIRAAARLNIELKRNGRRGLSNDVIVRLTQILRESLAQAASNVENTGPNDKS